MHELAPLIKDLAVILGIASLVTLIFQKIRQPVVLGYLVAGMIIGPYTPPHAFVTDIPYIKILSELGVIFLMFSLGLEFSFHKLKRVGFSAGITGVVEVITMTLLGLAAGMMLGWSFNSSLFLGAALSISSTTIIIKALEELNLKGKRFAELIFGILVVEDLLAILLLVGLTTVVTTNNLFSFNILWTGIKLIAVVGGWFLLGYFLVPPLFRRITSYISEETLTIMSIALCLCLVCIADYFNYSSALGAFIMGSILAETCVIHRIQKLIEPIRNIFAAVFFVSVGMLINPTVILENWTIVLLLCLLTIIGKIVITGLSAFTTGQSTNTSVRIGFGMAQIGEFSFIIIGLGLALNAINSALYPIIVAVSAITTFTTPYLIKFSGAIGQKIDNRLSPSMKYFLESYSAWIYRVLKSPKQQSTYRKALVRLIINAIIVAIIFILTTKLAAPEIIKLIGKLWLTEVICWSIALIFSSPFIWGMLVAFQLENSKIEKKTNRPQILLYVSWIFTLIEISILSIAYFDTWFIALIPIAIAVIFFSVLYKQLDKSYNWFENQLKRNLAASAFPHILYDRLTLWDTHIVEVEVNRQSALVNKPLSKYQLRRQFGINIVAIYRGNLTILAPRGDQIILPFDKLIVFGSDEQIEKFKQEFIKYTPEPEHAAIENFELKAKAIGEKDPLINKTIKESGLREKVNGIVVGMERQGTRTLNPDPAMLLKVGDVLYIVGETHHLKDI